MLFAQFFGCWLFVLVVVLDGVSLYWLFGFGFRFWFGTVSGLCWWFASWLFGLAVWAFFV